MDTEAVPALAVVTRGSARLGAATLAVAKALSMSGSDFAVTDAATGAPVLRVDGVLFSLRRRCVLVDADRRPVLTVQESALMLNTRWKVFRGDSTRRRDLMFSVVKPSVIQLRGPTKVSVFLASNDAEQACDFRITGSYHDGACAVSLGDSDTVIAKANRPAVQRGQRAAGEELVQRHRQPGDRLRLRRRARRHPRRDALPAMTRTLQFGSKPRAFPFCCCVESTLAPFSNVCRPIVHREIRGSSLPRHLAVPSGRVLYADSIC
uniref:Protein LURP-one-related 15 n=1 Tax=Zea mays TaxID=4577 RepID=A0A804RMT3_MAIZE